MEHAGVAKKARTKAASGSVDAGEWRHSRVPSVRDRAICVVGVAGGQAGVVGTSTQPMGVGGAAAVDSGGRVAICLVRSVPPTRQCVATREGGNAAGNATACSHNA